MFNSLITSKNILLVVATLAISNFNFSQTVSIGIESGHAISFNSIDPSNNPNLSPQFYDVAESFHASDKPAYSFSNAINVKTKLLNNLALINTVGQSRTGFNNGVHEQTFGDTGGAAPTRDVLFKHQFNYIDVSAGIQYYIPLRSIKFYIHSSFEYNYLTSYKQVVLIRDYSTRNVISRNDDNLTIERNISRNNISVNGGLGLEFNVTSNLHFFSHLNYKNMLQVINPNSMTQDRLYSYGIKLGLRMGL